VVFFVGWLSCDSVEYPFGETDGFGAIIRRIADQSGYATVRVDKPGVGDSEGPACSQLDFVRELAAYHAAFASISRFAFIDPTRVFVLGLSNGGGFAPLTTDGTPVRGYIAAGSWGRSWYEHMVEHERRRLMRGGTPLAQVDDAMRTCVEFYRLFLMQKATPGAILAEHRAWRPLWYDADDGMDGRPAAFYQQLQDLNVAAAWSRTNAAALVLRGSADTVMSRADSEALFEIVNRAHPGTATYREIDGADHLFTRGADFAGETVTTMREWMRSQLLKTKQPVGRAFKLQVSPGAPDPTYQVVGISYSDAARRVRAQARKGPINALHAEKHRAVRVHPSQGSDATVRPQRGELLRVR